MPLTPGTCRGPAVLAVVAILALGAGCGGEDSASKGQQPNASSGQPRDNARSRQAEDRPRRRSSRPVTFADFEALKVGTPRQQVEAKIGPPERSDSADVGGVVASCFLYQSVNRFSRRPDPNVDFQLCYDGDDGLSVKSAASREQPRK